MDITSLRNYQKAAIVRLETGSILRGGVGSGKSLTSLAYFYRQLGCPVYDILDPTSCIPDKSIDLYVITTAKKRDSLDWEKEAAYFSIGKRRENSINNIQLTVDSWNNIKKYRDVEGAFFIFDEQKTVGSGTWAKQFIKITKYNAWILLTATPGDTWMDYISVFIANGFYKNRTQFVREHVVFNNYVSFPKIERFLGVSKLKRLRDKVLVEMNFKPDTVRNVTEMIVPFDDEQMAIVQKKRWNVFKDKPIINGGEYCYAMRRVVNSNPERLRIVKNLAVKHEKLIVFYNFDYELEILRMLKDSEFFVAEYNGHKHELIPKARKWIYLVQYTAGAEAWNCIETNAMVFYSLNYSFRITEQASGRIDRMNTTFKNLYYYFLRSDSQIDRSIVKAQRDKTKFNEKKFLRKIEVIF